MDIRVLRRRNLRRVIDDRYQGKLANLERAHGIASSYLSQLLTTEQWGRSFGEKTARTLEGSMGLPAGFLDQEPSSQKLPPSAEALAIAHEFDALTPVQRETFKAVWNAIRSAQPLQSPAAAIGKENDDAYETLVDRFGKSSVDRALGDLLRAVKRPGVPAVRKGKIRG